jgi:hypothetical protein
VLVRVMAPLHVSDLVSVKGGFEAATWDTRACTQVLKVWRYWSNTFTWRRVARIYTPVAQMDANCIQQVVGGNVNGAPDGVFVVHGYYTGDGVGNAVLIANGPRGWGLLVGDNRSMTSTGKSAAKWDVNEGIQFYARFTHDLLEVVHGNNGWFGDGDSGWFPLYTWFRWHKGHFLAVHNNVFAAAPGNPVTPSSPALRPGNCPARGTYAASFGLRITWGDVREWGPVWLEVFPKANRYPTPVPCSVRVQGTFPISVRFGRVADPSSPNHGPLTNVQWVTAPMWVLASEFWYESADPQMGPYATPSSLKVNTFITDVGTPYDPNWKTNGGVVPVPAWGSVTFANGHLVAVSVAGTVSPAR